jgi:sugar phosphate isomerase/epimerase
MKVSFTTLGCPAWDLDTICAKARAYGYDGVDFRGLQGDLDVTRLPAFTTGAAATKRTLTDAGLACSGIGSSITVCVPEKRQDALDEAKRTIETAHGLGCVNVRIYGGGDLTKYSRPELVKIGLEGINAILALDGAQTLKWLFETHDNWIKSRDCIALLDGIPNPAFGALWDIGHTPRVGGETVAETWAAIGPRVGSTHLKDAVFDRSSPLAMEDGWHYVIPGTGQLPLNEAVALLKKNHYDGWLIFEHEKRWHPELLEPEVVFPAYANWLRPLIS